MEKILSPEKKEDPKDVTLRHQFVTKLEYAFETYHHFIFVMECKISDMHSLPRRLAVPSAQKSKEDDRRSSEVLFPINFDWSRSYPFSWGGLSRFEA